ncbi:uncharacterized protein METZ01_LOCUS349905, partial [marine metagenome]
EKGEIPFLTYQLVFYLNVRNKNFRFNLTLKNLMVLMRFKNVMKVF